MQFLKTIGILALLAFFAMPALAVSDTSVVTSPAPEVQAPLTMSLADQPEVMAAVVQLMLSPALYGVMFAAALSPAVFGYRMLTPAPFIAFGAAALLLSAISALPLAFVVFGAGMAVVFAVAELAVVCLSALIAKICDSTPPPSKKPRLKSSPLNNGDTP